MCHRYKKGKPKVNENQCALAREKGVVDAKFVSIGFSKEACRKALVKMIIKDELPFKFVEAAGFIKFMATCCPNEFMVLDVPTRRNLTFLMLRSALKFEKAFDRLKDEDGHYVNWFGADGGDENEDEKYRVGPPMEDDWDNSLDDSDDVLLSYMVKPMILKFVKYWGDNLEKVEQLCNSLKELLMKLYQSYNFGDSNSATKTSCMVQSSGISEYGDSSSLDPFAQYKKTKTSTQDGYSGQNEFPPLLRSRHLTLGVVFSTLFGDRIIEPIEEETKFYEVVEAEFVRPMPAQQAQAAKDQLAIE
ncbi:hypothetical protein WN944_000900 [Citrus x changshan-huyou]|uniref:Uncharacterized protein n=1 Tax=Citrus x changshan-huyou TaxID=2935761 RepID=A0AAP0QUA0_9ROSI